MPTSDISELFRQSSTIRINPRTSVQPEDLEGGQGREIFFRPERYHKAELGPVGVAVRVRLGDFECTCELHDISQNGIAFRWPGAQSVRVGALIDELTVTFDGHEAFRGLARVGSVRHESGMMIVGASFMDSLMNIEDVLSLRDVKAWMGGAGEGWPRLRRHAKQAVGHYRMKALIADLRLFLEESKVLFAELEGRLPWHLVHGDHDSPARDALLHHIETDFVSEFVRFTEAIDFEYRAVTEAELEPMKEYTRRMLHGLLIESPSAHRAMQKPLGYPGDFEVMRSMYEKHFSGSTLFAKALNYAFLSTRTVCAVRARKELIKERLCDQVALSSGGTDAPFRILSVAAGPAYEVHEMLREQGRLPRPLEVVLFDQDKRALAYAYGKLRRIVDEKWADQVRVAYLHDAIKRLLRDSSIFSEYGRFDAIVCSGLFDYLGTPTATRLCSHLCQNLAPGGHAYIGNMTPDNPSRWFMELHLDWTLVYRTREELLQLGLDAVPNMHANVIEEATGLNPFLHVVHC